MGILVALKQEEVKLQRQLSKSLPNADPNILEGSLMLIAIFGDVKSDIPWLPPRKVTDSASSAMRALARQIRDLGGYIGADVALREAATSTDIHQADLRIERAGLSELLLKYAEALDRCSQRRRSVPARIDNSSVCRFVDYIKKTTGRNHYPQAALLLDAAYNLYKKCKLRWDTNVLKQLLYRERLRRGSAKPPKEIVEIVLQ